MSQFDPQRDISRDYDEGRFHTMPHDGFARPEQRQQRQNPTGHFHRGCYASVPLHNDPSTGLPMHPRYALTLRTQLGLPLVPFVIDLGTRTIILWDRVAWYQLPDLWTLLVTYAFFVWVLCWQFARGHFRPIKKQTLSLS